MEIDIRDDSTESVNVIRFADAGVLQNIDGNVYITVGASMCDDAINIYTKEDVKHLINALQRALHLDWWIQ